MIPEVIATRVHHPKIRFGQRSLPETCGLLPGFTHVTQNHIYHPLSARVRFSTLFRSMHRLLLFEVNISFFHVLESFSVNRTSRLILWRCKQTLLSQTTLIRIAQEALDLILDSRAEEVALYGRDALGRLCGDDVYAEHPALWPCELNS